MPSQSTHTVAMRWEWRTFAPSLASLTAKLAVLPDTPALKSEETYLLQLHGPHNAKIRDGVFDIKRLQRIDEHGLEQWNPAFKARFPLSRADVIAAFEAWELPLPVLRHDAYAETLFDAEIVAPHPGLRIASVARAKHGFTFAGCIAELAMVRIDGTLLETFCLEHEDARLVLDALGTLGLDSHANVSYPEGLKHALGFVPAPA